MTRYIYEILGERDSIDLVTFSLDRSGDRIKLMARTNDQVFTILEVSPKGVCLIPGIYDALGVAFGDVDGSLKLVPFVEDDPA